MKLVFLHGAYSGKCCWNYFDTQIGVPQEDKIYLEFNVEDELLSIIQQLKQEIIEKCPIDEELVLIGYSFGGVLAYLLGHFELPHTKIKHIVTIASPLGGMESTSYVFLPFVNLAMPNNYFWKNDFFLYILKSAKRYQQKPSKYCAKVFCTIFDN